jgi:hypothetical protein
MNAHTDWMFAFAPLVGLGANVLAQALVARFLAGRIGKAMIASMLFGLATAVATAALGSTSWGRSSEAIADWGTLLITYSALSFGFWAFLNLNATSLRVRMLREMLHAGGTMTRAELLQRYPPEEFLSRRLGRLQRNGQMTLYEGRWRIRLTTLLRIARCMAFLRAIILPR